MQHGKEDARAHWKLQVADGMSEEFGSESGEYLYGFFGRFCQVWRVVEDGTVRLVQRGEKVPDWNGAFQENWHVEKHQLLIGLLVLRFHNAQLLARLAPQRGHLCGGCAGHFAGRKASTFARPALCIASSNNRANPASAAINSCIRLTPRPELLATAPNQLWSWVITKLLGPAKWTCFYLYVILVLTCINSS